MAQTLILFGTIIPKSGQSVDFERFSMDYTIQLDEENKLVVAAAKGDWDSDTDNSLILQILNMVDETGAQGVLLDIRHLRFKVSIVQIFERAKELRTMRLKFNKTSSRAAILYLADDPKLEEDMNFFETAARNRNLPYQVFKDIEEAINWLLGA